MTENEVAKIIVDTAYQIHVRLGPGLLESVYQEVLTYELRGLNTITRLALSGFVKTCSASWN